MILKLVCLAIKASKQAFKDPLPAWATLFLGLTDLQNNWLEFNFWISTVNCRCHLILLFISASENTRSLKVGRDVIVGAHICAKCGALLLPLITATVHKIAGNKYFRQFVYVVFKHSHIRSSYHLMSAAAAASCSTTVFHSICNWMCKKYGGWR